MKYGFELEFFVVDNEGKFQLCPIAVPHDDCLFLAEARGEPHYDSVKAAFLLKAEMVKISKLLHKENLVLDLTTSYTKLPKDLLRKALKLNGKAPYPHERHNMYGKDYRDSDTLQRAGLHVHFSNQTEVKDKEGKIITVVNGAMDMCRYINLLDVKFKAEIKAAKRVPGCYEIKCHGFEYRSLPSTIDVLAVAEVLNDAQ